MSAPSVTLLKLGSVLVIDDPAPQLKRILESTLVYDRMIVDYSDRRRRARGGRKAQPIDCYKYVRDEDGLFPDRFMCGAGYMSRLAKVLRSHGYQVRARDLKPHPRPEIFAPQWDRLRGVELRYKQRYFLERLLRVNFGRIDCPTGYGKTHLIKLIPRLLPRAKIAITTCSVDVLMSIYEDLLERHPRVGLMTGKTKRDGSRITCYSAKCLDHCTEPVDLLLVDEHYQLATDDNMRLLLSSGVRDARKYGFGANADDRADQAHFELEGVLGPVVARMTYQEGVEHGCIVPVEVRWVDAHLPSDPGASCRDPVAKERYSIWRNQQRNQLIADVANRLPRDQQVLISVFSLEHALLLRQLLPDFQVCYSEGGFSSEEGKVRLARYRNRGLLRPGEPVMTYERRERMRRDFESGRLKKVIATSVWDRGVDFRRLQVLIRADAKSSTIKNTQVPGRTSRLCDETGKRVGIIYDFRDQFSEKYQREAYRRRADYMAHGWQQVFENEELATQRRFNV